MSDGITDRQLIEDGEYVNCKACESKFKVTKKTNMYCGKCHNGYCKDHLCFRLLPNKTVISRCKDCGGDINFNMSCNTISHIKRNNECAKYIHYIEREINFLKYDDKTQKENIQDALDKLSKLIKEG